MTCYVLSGTLNPTRTHSQSRYECCLVLRNVRVHRGDFQWCFTVFCRRRNTFQSRGCFKQIWQSVVSKSTHITCFYILVVLSQYYYIIVCTKSQLGWLNLSHLATLPPPMTVKQRVVIIPGDQSEEEIDGYEGKDFEKRKVLRRVCKTSWEMSTSGPWWEYDDGEELGDDEGLNW